MNDEHESAPKPSTSPEPSEAETQIPSEQPGGEPEEKPRALPREYLLLFVPTFLFLCYLLVPIGERLDSTLGYPYQLDGEEGFIYQQAEDLRRGRSIYTPIETEPYLVGNYPPLFPWVLSLLIGPGREGLVLGRALVACAAVVVVQMLLLLAYWRTRQLVPTFLAPLLFLGSYEFYEWSPYCRVDLPALALTGAGLLIFVAVKPRWGAAAAAVLFVAAAYTRQTALAAPAACTLAMLFGDRRRLVWFLVPFIGLGLAIFGVLHIATEGQFFLHVVQYNRNEMDWVSFRSIMRNEIWFFYRWWIVAIVLGVASLIGSRAARTGSPDSPTEDSSAAAHTRGLFGWYFGFCALSLVGFAKVGSAPNYALEPLAAAALFAAVVLGRLAESGGGGASAGRRYARIGVVAMGAALTIHSIRASPFVLRMDESAVPAMAPAIRALKKSNVSWAMFSGRNPNEEDRRVGQIVVRAVREAEGDVLSEAPIFTFLAGKDVLYEPFIMSRLAAEGVWDEAKFTDPIGRRRFSLIVTMQDLREVERGAHLWRFTDTMARSILNHYKLEWIIGPRTRGGLGQVYYLWLPRERDDADPETSRIAAAGLAV